MPRGRPKKGNPPPPRKKVTATTQPATTDAVAPQPDIAATVAARKQTKTSDDSLIESRLTTPPRKNDDDENSTDSESDKESQEENSNPKTPTQTVTVERRTSPRVTTKKKLPVSATRLDNSKSAPSVATQSSETLIILQREHSMFLNCVPATRQQLGADVVAKIRSVVRNTLFKSAKFYPQPSHADKVVGICLYDCDFRLPGLKGDLNRTKHWDAVRSEIINQTSILRQQVVPKWHVVARGKFFWLFIV